MTCAVCFNDHHTEKRLSTEALLDLLTQRQAHFEANWQRYSLEEMDEALFNLHRLSEHVASFIDRLREALTMEDE